MTWMKQHKMMVILLVLMLTIIVPASLNYSGMCIPEGRWLSDEERIRLATEAVINGEPNHNQLDEYFHKKLGDDAYYKSFHEPGGPRNSYGALYLTYYDPKIWKRWENNGLSGYKRIGTAERIDADKFIKKSPHCCKSVGPENSGPILPSTFWGRISGLRADVIEVEYPAKFVKNGEIVEINDYTEYPIITNCGRLFTRP